MTKKDKNYHRFYTDGACSMNPGPGGWGVVWLKPDGSVVEMGGHAARTTNNEMELKAVVETLLVILKEQIHSEIYTDSQYVIKGVNEWMRGWSKRSWQSSQGEPIANLDLWKEIHRLVVEKKLEKLIQWKWVKGHSGDVGNERADEIAVSYSKNTEPLARQLDFTQSPSNESYPIYLSFVSGVLERHKTWVACELAVKGRSGAKFKKVKSHSEEQQLLKQWGAK